MATRKHRSSRKNRPLPQELPPYLLARDELALAAGLKVERHWGGFDDCFLITKYVGPTEVLRASAFVTHKDAFRVPTNESRCVKRSVWDYPAPGEHSLVGAFRRGEQAYVKYQDFPPVAFGMLEHGVEFYVYDGPHHRRTVRRGTRDALVAEAVVAAGELPTLAGLSDRDAGDLIVATVRGRRIVVSEWHHRGDDLFDIVTYPDREERASDLLESGEERNYPHADSFREELAKLAEACARVTFETLSATGRGRDGLTFQLERGARQRIGAILESLQAAVDSASVVSTPAHRQLDEEIEPFSPRIADPGFERFLGDLVKR